MLTAVFEHEPDAEAAAIVLRNDGFDAKVTLKNQSGENYDDRMRDFFSGREHPFEVHAVLTSDARSDEFAREVIAHHGHVVDDGHGEL
ncbi:MAG TPA: hypothetical protein VGK84_05935 [Candidatus Tumulicola sp.]|jgi:hypothetical protein